MIRNHHTNGQLWYEIPQDHLGRPHGTEKGWHKDGQIESEIMWHEGRRVGVAKWWHRNGTMSCKHTYNDGRQFYIERWREDGQFLFKLYFVRGKEVTHKEYISMRSADV